MSRTANSQRKSPVPPRFGAFLLLDDLHALRVAACYVFTGETQRHGCAGPQAFFNGCQSVGDAVFLLKGQPMPRSVPSVGDGLAIIMPHGKLVFDDLLDNGSGILPVALAGDARRMAAKMAGMNRFMV